MIRADLEALGPVDDVVCSPGYQPSIGTQGRILRYLLTISPSELMRTSELYGFLFGCSSWRSPVMENTPHTPAVRHASAKISVSNPGTLAALSNISWRSYMIPCVEYSGKMIRSIPGKPCLIPTTMSAICSQLRSDALLVVQAGHLVVDDRHTNAVVAAADVPVPHLVRPSSSRS